MRASKILTPPNRASPTWKPLFRTAGWWYKTHVGASIEGFSINLNNSITVSIHCINLNARSKGTDILETASQCGVLVFTGHLVPVSLPRHLSTSIKLGVSSPCNNRTTSAHRAHRATLGTSTSTTSWHPALSDSLGRFWRTTSQTNTRPSSLRQQWRHRKEAPSWFLRTGRRCELQRPPIESPCSQTWTSSCTWSFHDPYLPPMWFAYRQKEKKREYG